MADAMLKALRELPEQAKAIVLTAEGDDFCAGRRGGMPQGATKLTAIDIRKRVIEPVLDLYQALRNTPVMLKVLETRKDRDQAVSLVAEGFDMLEEDLEEERFFAAVRRTFWAAPDKSPTRALCEYLITKLDF